MRDVRAGERLITRGFIVLDLPNQRDEKSPNLPTGGRRKLQVQKDLDPGALIGWLAAKIATSA